MSTIFGGNPPKSPTNGFMPGQGVRSDVYTSYTSDDTTRSGHKNGSGKIKTGRGFPRPAFKLIYELLLHRRQQSHRNEAQHDARGIRQIDTYTGNQNSEDVAGHFTAGEDQA